MSSYSSDDAPPPPPPSHHVKKASNRSHVKPVKHMHPRKAGIKPVVGQVRVLKRGQDQASLVPQVVDQHAEDDDNDSYTDTGDSKDEAIKAPRRKSQRPPQHVAVDASKAHTHAHHAKSKKTAKKTAAAPVASTTRASSECTDVKKKKKKATINSTHTHTTTHSHPWTERSNTLRAAAAAAAVAPRACLQDTAAKAAWSIALLNPPSPARATTPTAQPVKVYGLEHSSPVSIQARARVASTNSSPRKASPGGGEYAGPTFSNSPAPSTLPKPAFTGPQKTSPPSYSLEYKPPPSKRSGLADAAFWMEGGIMSGSNTTANVTPSESPGSRSGGVTPIMFTAMGTLLAPIPTHRQQPYTDELLQVGNPNGPHVSAWRDQQQHDDGGSGSMLLELLRGTSISHNHQVPQEAQTPSSTELDVWSQGLKSLLKMS